MPSVKTAIFTNAFALAGSFAYSTTGGIMTITRVAHGHLVGHRVSTSITSGLGTGGVLEVLTVIDADNFQVADSGGLTDTGTLNILSGVVVASSGVHSITHVSTGRYVINFSEAFPDSNFLITGTPMRGASGRIALQNYFNQYPWTTSIEVATYSSDASFVNSVQTRIIAQSL